MAEKTGLTRGQLARIIQIQTRLSRRRGPGDKVTALSLARELGVSSRTIKRDLEYMRDSAGLPLEYEPADHSWKLTAAVGAFPMVSVTEGEVVALVLAQSALLRYRGMPFERQLNTALDKLAAALPASMAVDWGELSRVVSFRELSCPVLDFEVFNRLADAVIRRRGVAFSYVKNGATGPERRRVLPYHLTAVGFEWYLVSYDEVRKGLRHFRLSGISEVKVNPAPFSPPQDFEPQRHFAGGFGLFTGDEVSQVRIRFTGTPAKIIAKGCWHPTQVITENPDGSAVLTMTTGGLHEIARWVISFGGAAQALEPEALREIVVARCQGTLRCHT